MRLRHQYYHPVQGRSGRSASQILLVALCKVLIRVAILHESRRHRSHKAEDDFPHGCEVLELGSDTTSLYILEIVRVPWWSYSRGILLHYKKKLFAKQT